MTFARFAAGIFALLLGLASATARAQAPAAGGPYQLVDPPQKTETGNKIEVIEFFSYACPHCNEFEPHLQAWLKKKPKDMAYRMVPMVFRQEWLPFAKLYYTLEAMDLLDKHHTKVYEAIYKDQVALQDPAILKKWVERQGIDAKKFFEIYDSFGVDAKTQRSMTLARAYGVTFTPAMVVNGKYRTGPSMTPGPDGMPSYQRFFQVLDQLVAMARGKPAAKKKS